MGILRRSLLVAASVAIVLTMMLGPPPAAAAVTQPLTLTEQVSGAPGAVWTITGCSIPRTALTDNGATINVVIVAALPCTLTVAQPPPSTNNRYVTTAGATSYTVVVSSSPSTDSHDDWYQDKVAVSYLVIDGGSPTAPTFSYTSAGSPSTYTMTATSTTVWVDHGTSWSFTNPTANSGSSERWETSTASGTSSGGLVVAPVYYHQFQPSVSYSVVAGTPSGNAKVLTYFSLGTSTGYTLTTTATAKWIDAATITVGDNYVSATERYSQGQNQTLGSASAMVFAIYHQYKLQVMGGNGLTMASIEYGRSGTFAAPNWSDSGSTATTSSNGVWGRSGGVGQRLASWNVDGGTNAKVVTAGIVTTSLITMSVSHTVNFNAVTQYEVSLNAPAAGVLSSVTAPTISGDKYWYDSGSALSLVLNGTQGRSDGSGTRLASYSINGGTNTAVATTAKVTALSLTAISAAEAVVANVVTQYQLTLDPGATAALSTMTQPPIQGDNYWYDSGTAVAYQGTGVYGRASGAGSRVEGYSVNSGASTNVLTNGAFQVSVPMSSPHTIHVTSINQYQVELTGTYSVASATQPTIAGDDYWYDSGTSVSLSIEGVFSRTAGVGERTTSYSLNGGSQTEVATLGSIPVLSGVAINGPEALSVSAVRQFQVSLDADAARAMSSMTPPTLSGDTSWYDSGVSVSVMLNGVWGRNATAGLRLASYTVNQGQPVQVATLGKVAAVNLPSISAPQSVSALIVTQYFLTVFGGGGATFTPGPTISGDKAWFDSGTAVRVSTNATYGSDGSTRQRITSWSLDGGVSNQVGMVNVLSISSFTMNGPHTVTFSSVTQYHVTVLVKDNSGAQTLVPQSLVFLVNGFAENAAAGTVWVDSGATVTSQEVIWNGVNVAPAQPVQDVVSSPLVLTLNAKVYELTVTVKDPFGATVGGATVTVGLANGTSVQRTSGGDGTAAIGLVSAGEYTGIVSSFGASSSFSGDASTQSSVKEEVSLSYQVLGLIVVVVVLVVVALVLVLRRGRISVWAQS